jgi:serine protease Do
MKEKFLLMLCTGLFLLTTYSGFAQEDVLIDNKEEEFIIRKKGNKDVKVTIETKDDNVLINGKPLSEFKDDNVSVIKSRRITGNGNNLFIAPRGGNRIFLDEGNEARIRPFLGVTTEKKDDGVLVTDVAEGSAAEKAGLKEGDIITTIGNTKIPDPEALMDAVKSYKPKDEIKISYLRNGKANNAKAILGERREHAARSFLFNRDKMPAMDSIMENFHFEMPPMPDQPFHNFNMPKNKKLGVKVEDAENESGAKIIHVEQGSAAETAGLKKDDIITEVDGVKVKNIHEVRKQVWKSDKDNFTIKVKRGSADMNFDIKIPKKVQSANL